MIDALVQLFGQAQQWLFEAAVQPLLFALGQGALLEDAYNATGWLLVGLLQLAVMLALIGPLQRLRPAEPVRDRAAIRPDIAYTLLHRLGLFRVGLFFLVDPLWQALWGALAVHGFSGWHLDEAIAPWWPAMAAIRARSRASARSAAVAARGYGWLLNRSIMARVRAYPASARLAWTRASPRLQPTRRRRWRQSRARQRWSR